MTVVEAVDVLRHEFNAEPGSFLGQVATAHWDREAFSRLERAMREVCADRASDDRLDRWLAEGFFYFSAWVRDQTSYAAFPCPEPDSYYHACLDRLWELADWFFRGYHMFEEDHSWTDL